MFKKTFTIFLLLVMAYSCSVQKRKYRPGFDIQWKHQVNEKKSGSDSETLSENKTSGSVYSEKTLATGSNESNLNIQEEVSHEMNINETSFEISSKGKEVIHVSNNSKIREKKDKIGKENTMTTKKKEKESYSDSFLYTLAGAMFLLVLGAQKLMGGLGNKITRWAKNNPKKTIGIIAALQAPIAGFGIYSGYDMKEMGMDLSEYSSLIFGGLLVTGFLVTPFFHKKTEITTPAKVNFNRAVFAGMMISALMLAVGNGNNIQDFDNKTEAVISNENNSELNSVEAMESSQENTHAISKNGSSSKTSTMMMVASASLFGIIMLSMLVCVGVCVVILGIAMLIGLATGGGVALLLGIPVIVIGVLIAKATAEAIVRRADR